MLLTWVTIDLIGGATQKLPGSSGADTCLPLSTVNDSAASAAAPVLATSGERGPKASVFKAQHAYDLPEERVWEIGTSPHNTARVLIRIEK